MNQKWKDGQTGVMTVRSGRWLPPAQGWLLRITSPSFRLFPNDLICGERNILAGENGQFNLPHRTGTYRKDGHLVLHCLLHRPQVDRDVRRIGNQAAVRAKHGTGKVESLFDVGGN